MRVFARAIGMVVKLSSKFETQATNIPKKGTMSVTRTDRAANKKCEAGKVLIF